MNVHKRKRTERLLYWYARTERGLSEELAYRFKKTIDTIVRWSLRFNPDIFPPE